MPSSPSDTAKKVLANRPEQWLEFDKLFNDFRVTMSYDSAVSAAVRDLRDKDKKSTGGLIIKGGDYIKDLL